MTIQKALREAKAGLAWNVAVTIPAEVRIGFSLQDGSHHEETVTLRSEDKQAELFGAWDKIRERTDAAMDAVDFVETARPFGL